MDDKFRFFLDKSNFIISSLVVRSLFYDNIKNKLFFDELRLRDELHFYKYIVKSQKSSIVSALYPIIYGNVNVYTGYEEAIKLFCYIRKNINSVEQYSLFLLSKIIKNIEIQKEDIFEFTIENITKEEAINLQKAKIQTIMKFDNMLEVIFDNLKEEQEYIEIFNYNSEVGSDLYKDILTNYFVNLCQGRILTKKYTSYKIELIDQMFDMNKGDTINCSLIPQGLITKKEINSYNITITLETKNTIYKLLKKV